MCVPWEGAGPPWRGQRACGLRQLCRPRGPPRTRSRRKGSVNVVRARPAAEGCLGRRPRWRRASLGADSRGCPPPPPRPPKTLPLRAPYQAQLDRASAPRRRPIPRMCMLPVGGARAKGLALPPPSPGVWGAATPPPPPPPRTTPLCHRPSPGLAPAPPTGKHMCGAPGGLRPPARGPRPPAEDRSPGCACFRWAGLAPRAWPSPPHPREFGGPAPPPPQKKKTTPLCHRPSPGLAPAPPTGKHMRGCPGRIAAPGAGASAPAEDRSPGCACFRRAGLAPRAWPSPPPSPRVGGAATPPKPPPCATGHPPAWRQPHQPGSTCVCVCAPGGLRPPARAFFFILKKIGAATLAHTSTCGPSRRPHAGGGRQRTTRIGQSVSCPCSGPPPRTYGTSVGTPSPPPAPPSARNSGAWGCTYPLPLARRQGIGVCMSEGPRCRARAGPGRGGWQARRRIRQVPRRPQPGPPRLAHGPSSSAAHGEQTGRHGGTPWPSP